MTATNRPNDPTRAYVAIAKLCKALGVPADADVPDHVLLERLAESAREMSHTYEVAHGKPKAPCACPGCNMCGDA